MLRIVSVLSLITLVLSGCMAQKTNLGGLPMSALPAQKSIDMRGKTITPFILYHAVQNLNQMNEGDILEIGTDNFEAIENDIRAWTRMTGHVLADLENGSDYQRYYIKKADVKRRGKKLAMVISNPALEMLIAPLGVALSSALSGDDVYIYFQGPAVRVLKKKYVPKLSGLGRPFSSFARKGMARVGHLPPGDKLEQLKELGAHLYVCGGSMEPFGVKKSDLIFDDIIIAEYFTFLEIMDSADINMYLQ